MQPRSPLQSLSITEATGFLINQPDMITHREEETNQPHLNFQSALIYLKIVKNVRVSNRLDVGETLCLKECISALIINYKY